MKNELREIYVMSGILIVLGALLTAGVIIRCQFDDFFRQRKIRRRKKAAVRQYKTKKFQTISGAGRDHIFDHDSPYH